MQKGEKHHQWGKSLSGEHRKKISEAHKGKQFSEESKRKMSEAKKGKKYRLGKHHSEKSKRKIGKAMKGNKPRLGKRHSEESKRKMSETRKGEKSPRWGKPHSEETKRKIGEAQKGEKSNNWKGGITPIVTLIRESSVYEQWRSDVFIRDDFTCQKCGEKGGILEAHHIESFNKLIQKVKEYLPLLSLYDGAMIYAPLWNIDNGITLCKKHHRLIK